MNNTKWKEIFDLFSVNECEGGVNICWRTKDAETGYLSSWDGTWTHFGCEPREWEFIDYLQIQLTPENQELVIKILKQVHVPGDIDKNIVTVYGYKSDVDYI